MALPDNSSFVAEKFSGIARLFPLPNLVVFPHVMQPLHIFEPRYRAMLEEALAGDQLITMAVLMPGWEKDYEGRPPVFPIACLCKVVTHQRTDEGKYNVLIVGMKRVEIVAELPASKLFREAKVRLRHDDYLDESASDREARQQELFDRFKRILPAKAETNEQLDQLLGKHAPLGMLTDLVAYALDMGIDRKVALLAEANVDRRADVLLRYIAELDEGQGARATFPPDFSVN
jgi:ATP-dependent Lon protease